MLSPRSSVSAAILGALTLLGVTITVVLTSFTFENPTLKETIEAEMKPVPEETTQEWYAVVTAGKLKGSVSDAFSVVHMTKAQLQKLGANAIKFTLRECVTYSDTGTMTGESMQSLALCTVTDITREEVLAIEALFRVGAQIPAA